MDQTEHADEQLEPVEPARPYPAPAVPLIAGAGALMTGVALSWALTSMEPYTWALAPFVLLFAVLPYFAIAITARRVHRPVNQLVLAAGGLVLAAIGGFAYANMLIHPEATPSVGTFIEVPLWQTLPAALTVAITWLLEPQREVITEELEDGHG